MVLLLSCTDTPDPNELATMEEAVAIVAEWNQIKLARLQQKVDELGKRPTETQRLSDLQEWLTMMQGEWSAEQLHDETKALLTRQRLDVNGTIAQCISRIEHFQRMKPTNTRHHLYLQFNKEYLIYEVISLMETLYGTSDITFATCCDIQAATNFNPESSGLSTSVVLSNRSAAFDVEIGEVQVLHNDRPVAAEVTQMNDILLVNFTPSAQGDYKIKYLTRASVMDTTIVERVELSLNQLAKNE